MEKKIKTIGIIGGGQLGRMLTEAAHKLRYKVIVLDGTPNSPAGLVADEQIVGSFKNRNKILELAKLSDFITFEIESADIDALEELVKEGKPVNPNPKILKVIKDKFGQKVFLTNHNIPVAQFALVESETDCLHQSEIFGYPYLLKARFDAYDGRGNHLIKNKIDIKKGLKKLSSSPLYAEKFVRFKKELSLVCARDTSGRTIFYPVVETIHKNNICHIVKSPANISKEIQKKAELLAEDVLEILRGVGVFAIEMFLTKDDSLVVNEVAPRVHNSGHHTIEAFNTSQFEQHIRAITGMYLVPLESKAKTAVMINILGQRNGTALPSGMKEAEDLGNTTVHIYGKKETKPERKMGHITVLADTVEIAEKKAKKARRMVQI